MKHNKLLFAIVVLGCYASLLPGTHAQGQEAWESERVNVSMGGTLAVPMGSTTNFVENNPGIVAGAGYNFGRRHSIIGEFLWNGLEPTNQSFQPIRAAAQDNSITGHSNLYAVTGNYRFQLQGKVFGVYAIAGGGWYYRTAGLSKPVTSGVNTACTPAWLWWGFSCASGIVTPNQTVGQFNSSALGGNGGVGFTFKVAEPSYRIFVEPRYHYAPTKGSITRLLNITVGIRY